VLAPILRRERDARAVMPGAAGNGVMEGTDWLLMLARDGTVEAVDGGAPTSWLARRVEDCADLPEAVKGAARKLLRDLAQPLAGTLLRRARVAPEAPGEPSFTLLAVEGILVRPAETALGPLVQRALDPLVRQAEAELVSLEIDLAGEAPQTLSIDADKIAWALAAVVGNALRYMRRGDGAMPGGNIRVRAARSAARRMVSITVQDDGPGIPPSVQPWLLAPDPSTGRAAGIGLRLVHDIVAAHGGGMVIKSSSEPSQRGTTVTLWLPVRG
jgi:signal transduction histidine kinase